MEKQSLSTVWIYVLSILGLPLCCCAGLGFIPAGIAYFMANGSNQEILQQPRSL